MNKNILSKQSCDASEEVTISKKEYDLLKKHNQEYKELLDILAEAEESSTKSFSKWLKMGNNERMFFEGYGFSIFFQLVKNLKINYLENLMIIEM